MNEIELIEWVMENGGSVIKFRTATELMNNCSENLKKELTDYLLNSQKVESLLSLLDNYGPITSADIKTLNAIHTGSGVEGIVAKLLNMGLKEGVALFDEKMQVFRQYVHNDLVLKALNEPNSQDVDNGRAIFIAVLLASYFVWGGYKYNEIIDFIKHRIGLLYKMAKSKGFNIYLTEAELKKLPKRPKIWESKPVIRPEFDPWDGDNPLPCIHDIFCLAYLPHDFIDIEHKNKINTIIQYILEKEFQLLPEGYGLLWSKTSRRYYSCGWNPGLPCFFYFDSELQKSMLVLYLDLMSHFKIAVESDWFQNCLSHLEQYRTELGTYCFPTNYLIEKKDCGYVFGQSMGLEENRRIKRAFEIESTFRMLLIKKRMREAI